MTYNRRIHPSVIIYGSLSLLMIAFIFGQSLLPPQQSEELSHGIADRIYPILEPLLNVSLDRFHHILRKAAHFTEFFVLGMFITGFCLSLRKQYFRSFFSLGLLLCLSVAVGDEFLQYFTARGSAVTDIVIDFMGALSSTLLIYLAHILLRRNQLRL